MKPLILFIAISIISISSWGQERGGLIDERKIDAASMRREMAKLYPDIHATARKATAGGDRWYNYGEAIDTSTSWQLTLGGALTTAFAPQTIWNDTNGMENRMSGLAHNTIVSQANIFDPKARLFNRDEAFAYCNTIEVTSGDAYTCDSVDIFGKYEFNKMKTSVVDTLRLLFTNGGAGGNSVSNVYDDTLVVTGHYSGHTPGKGMAYDHARNIGTGSQTASLHYQDIVLANSGLSPAWGDTMANGIWRRRIAVNGSTGIAAAKGDLLGWTVTFISGDPETKGTGKLATPTPGDTLVNSGNAGENEYNVWRPLLKYYAIYGANTPAWAPYLESASPIEDHNLGLWRRMPDYGNGWDSAYIPIWDFDNSGGPTIMQYPFISWHINCATCKILPSCGPDSAPLINKSEYSINVSPNPAADELNISYWTRKEDNVYVWLQNMMGQTVISGSKSNTVSGNVILNTSALPAGVYIYNIQAGGEVKTGKVVIAR